MNQFQRILGVALLVMLLAGCSLFKRSGKGGGDEVVEPSGNKKSKGALTHEGSLQDEQELKVAKLWARVDELEEEVFRQKERLKLIEKGLITGIAPDALTKKSVEKPKEAELSEPPQLVEEDEATAKGGPAQDGGPNELSAFEQEEYGKRLETARGLFTSARFGKAIAEYERILAEFGPKIDGGFIKYWIGRSWRQLKEYTTAEEILNEVLDKHASSPWIPRVHYELAKVYIDANNLASAREKLKFIKNKYQYEDVSELATRELEDLPKKL